MTHLQPHDLRVPAPLPAGRWATVRVPATSANLGPGFDSMGLAVALYDVVTVTVLPADPGAPSVVVDVEGEGAGAVPTGEEHLVVRTLRSGLAAAGVPAHGPGAPRLRLTCRNRIPHGRGLGSSAAAGAVGLVAARALLTDDDRDRVDETVLLDLATDFEGHPDNAAAALLGGCTISWMDAEHARAACLRLHPGVRAVLCVPAGQLPTSRARAMLPTLVPHGDAAFNAGRSALLVHALTSAPELLLAATQDRLHQQQRAGAMVTSSRLIGALRDQGLAAVVSGAGPSVLVLGAEPDLAARVASVCSADWSVEDPGVDTEGAHVLGAGEG